MSAALRVSRRGLAFVFVFLLSVVCVIKLVHIPPSTHEFASVRINSCRLPPFDTALSAAGDANSSLIRRRPRDASGGRLSPNDAKVRHPVWQFPSNDDGRILSHVGSNASRIGDRQSLPAASSAVSHPGRRLPSPSNYVPATVYFVWCNSRRRTFRFPHYLSVRAAIHAFQADAVWFYYSVKPTVDRWSYETWLGELEAEFPFFRPRSLFDLGHLDACVRNRPADNFVAWLVSTRGGIYVDIETAIADFRPSLRSFNVLAAYTIDKRGSSGIVQRAPGRRLRLLMAKQGQLCDGTVKEPAVQRIRVTTCLGAASGVAAIHTSPICFVLPDSLLPKDLWTDSSSGGAVVGDEVGRYLRTAIYGRPEMPKPAADYSNLVPNIGHTIWVGGGQMKFVFFLSVMSMLHCAGVDEVYLHGNKPPSGPYWELILATQKERVKFVHREDIGQV